MKDGLKAYGMLCVSIIACVAILFITEIIEKSYMEWGVDLVENNSN